MGLRFRRSLKVAPGLKLNLSGRGASFSLGGRGATVNVSPKGTALTVGIPGTGISYRTSGQKPTSSAVTANFIVQHSIATGDGPTTAECTITPEETSYRLAALLACASIGGADTNEVEARIAGILPERLPNGLTSPLIARGMVALALTLARTSRGGTAAVRQALRQSGFGDDMFVAQAVAAVRASEKLRFARGVASGPPLQYVKLKGGAIDAMEFEPPSVRSRLPPDALAELHEGQLKIGRERLANPDLLKKRTSAVGWIAAVTFLAAIFVTSALLNT